MKSKSKRKLIKKLKKSGKLEKIRKVGNIFVDVKEDQVIFPTLRSIHILKPSMMESLLKVQSAVRVANQKKEEDQKW